MHNQAVRDYLVGAGLPENEIASVVAHPRMTQTYEPGGDPAQSLQLESCDSVISRQVGGIPVADSMAWARLNNHRPHAAGADEHLTDRREGPVATRVFEPRSPC